MSWVSPHARSTSSGVNGASSSSAKRRMMALLRSRDTEDVFQLALLQRRDGGGGDHAAVGDDADPADMKAFAQTVDHRQQHGGVGGVARQHLGANPLALAVDDNGEDHLLQVWPVILRMAVSPKAVAAGAVERHAGRVHED